jgi:hypothetical protein
MNFEEYSKEKLWLILVDTAHANVMYPTHKAYTRAVILRERPNLTPVDLAASLNMPFGEALVILNELQAEAKSVT